MTALPEQLLTPREVAALFRVDPKTVTRWAQEGRLSAVRTLGGHRRYHALEVYALLAEGPRQDNGASDAQQKNTLKHGD